MHACPIGEGDYIREFLTKRSRQISEQVDRLLALEHAFADDMGAQILALLLRQIFPAKVLHLLRSCSLGHCLEWIEDLEETQFSALARLLRVPRLTALQKRLANLPCDYGGAGLVPLHTLALVARATALVQLPVNEQARAALTKAFEVDMADLLPRLTAVLAHPAQSYFRDTLDGRNPYSVKTLQKRILALASLHEARTLHLQCADSEEAWLHHWISRLAMEDPSQPRAHPGMSSWLLSYPQTQSLRLSGEVLRWGWRELLGIAQPGQARTCQRILANGMKCEIPLDKHSSHIASCDWSVVVRRHNYIRGLVCEVARLSGTVAMPEQRMPVPEELQDGDAPRDPRALRTADVQAVDNSGNSIFVDIRCTTRPVGNAMAPWLQRHARSKRSEYGARPDTLAANIYDHIRPFIVETHGRLDECAIAVLEHFVRAAAGARVASWGMPWPTAIHQIRMNFYQQLSAGLLRFRHLAWSSCCSEAMERPALPS